MANEVGDHESPVGESTAMGDLVRGHNRRQGPECVSDLQLDQLALGEAPGIEADRVRLHLQQCATCEQAATRLARDRERFTSEVDFATAAATILGRAHIPTSSSLRRWGRALAWPGALSAAAVAGLLAIAPPASLTRSPAAGARAKGAALSLSTYVKFAGQDQPGTLHMGQPLGAGDRLQFRVTTDRPGHLAILSIDQEHEVSVFYPPGPTATAVPAGRDQALTSAVELDETPGDETIVALLCDHEEPVSVLVDAARAAAAGASGDGGPIRRGCVEARTHITKRPPASAP